jgi:HMG box factor, other
MSGPSGPAAVAGAGKTSEEQIMSMSFQYKVKVLGQVAPPAPFNDSPRGPLVAIEGDSATAVAELGRWLHDELRKGDDLAVNLFDGPDVSAHSDKKPMVQYHLLATEWLSKSDDVLASISYKPNTTPVDSAMSGMSGNSPLKERAQSSRNIDENYDDSDEASPKDQDNHIRPGPDAPKEPHPQTTENEKMDMHKTPSATQQPAGSSLASSNAKPVGMIANFSLHASNVFACRITIGPHDPYSPSDHWQWTATQWRGVVGPDLTIFVRDAVVGETGKPTVEISSEGNLFVVKRTKSEGDKGWELDASALRRLGFEVGEWVRAFGAEKKASA